MDVQQVTLGGGCFWCLEAVFERVDGVVAVENGYCNGALANPSYEQVCSGRTGHAEVVQLSFDAERITLRELLEIFYVIHDPTTRDRQGNDVGSQYRSGIYWQDPAHEAVARAVTAEVDAAIAAARGGGVVTEIVPRANYSRAEDYHQHYYVQHPEQGYCAYVVAPKVEKFKRTFAARVKPAAA
ncbi:MAG: peptide-methionine (S)-S-oxide reductase MsrA [Burkholderiales bacterium]|nr:peptide-methionine (S)-S-oxide reductase MsrA [Burkholderiales bacterium]